MVLTSQSNKVSVIVTDDNHVDSPFSCAATAVIRVLNISCDTSSVQLSTYDEMSSGTLDNMSALLLNFPGLYLIVKLNSASSPIHQRPVVFNLAEESTYVMGLLSVYTVKLGA